MSAAPARQVQPIRPAATVILVRDGNSGDDALETLMLKRTSDAAFAGGMYVFPGGRVEGDDHLHVYDALRRGPSEAQAAQRAALGDEWRGYWVACIRESFEEAGILLAYDADGRFLDSEDVAMRERYEQHRHDLNAGRVALDEICARERLALAIDRVHFLNRWITPEGRPRRFDTRFFVAVAPAGQRGRHDARETTDSRWITPREAIARNDSGEFGLMAVTRRQLEMLAGFESVAGLEATVLAQREHPTFRPELPRD